jgi:hypothetical protein
MKKSELREVMRGLELTYEVQSADLAKERRKVQALTAEVKQMREHWRPVPITHEWQPKNPQCMLCDEPRDAVRHRVDAT